MYNSDKSKRGHAVALFSGGLDSILALRLIQEQNIEVTALTFMTHFGCDIDDRSSCGHNPYPSAEKFGFKAKLMHLGQKFVDIVEKPKYGHGKNLNPCIDCRLLMIEEAKNFMDLIGADFVITGEVLGQRPKSQRRDSMMLVDRECGLEGRLLRPLSAKLFPETIPEKNGLVNRDLLKDFNGRSRKPQMKLAEELGVTDYPNPAGGCLLTDSFFSLRLKDVMNHNDGKIDSEILPLLRRGRHFRLDDRTKLIVGRDEADNDHIEACIRPEYQVFEAEGSGSPITVMIGEATQKNIDLAAAITARYCKLKNEPEVEISRVFGETKSKLIVEPADDTIIDQYRVS